MIDDEADERMRCWSSRMRLGGRWDILDRMLAGAFRTQPFVVAVPPRGVRRVGPLDMTSVVPDQGWGTTP